MCWHCDEDPPRRHQQHGLCNSCNSYRHLYRRLPPDRVLLRRWARRATP